MGAMVGIPNLPKTGLTPPAAQLNYSDEWPGRSAGAGTSSSAQGAELLPPFKPQFRLDGRAGIVVGAEVSKVSRLGFSSASKRYDVIHMKPGAGTAMPGWITRPPFTLPAGTGVDLALQMHRDEATL